MTEELFIEKEFSKIDFFTDRIVKVHGAHHPELSDGLCCKVFLALFLRYNLN